jgi:hypothetical protein
MLKCYLDELRLQRFNVMYKCTFSDSEIHGDISLSSSFWLFQCGIFLSSNLIHGKANMFSTNSLKRLYVVRCVVHISSPL